MTYEHLDRINTFLKIRFPLSLELMRLISVLTHLLAFRQGYFLIDGHGVHALLLRPICEKCRSRD